MPRPEKKKYGRLIWIVPIILAVCVPLGITIGDLILICAVYGWDAYFKNGLRIVKHKPVTLSSGVVLSDNLAFLGWLIDAAICFALVFVAATILERVYTWLKRPKKGEGEPRSSR